MPKLPKDKRLLPSALMVAVAGAATAGTASAGEQPRALALSVVENSGSVEIELIAQTETTQQVEYALELTGSSTSSHRGNTSITGGDRHILSRLKTSFSDSWCAKVDVTEGNGARYTLTAGDCAQA